VRERNSTSKTFRQSNKEQVGLGMKDGEAKIEQYLESGQKNINGWKVGSLFGDAAWPAGIGRTRRWDHQPWR
jgi:hypothetical protein